jgi:YbgC/YbaW family acyl-CoA thioester hydrolase
MKSESATFEYPLTIVETHIDTLGHVNNATYLQIFEEARWELITKNGYGLKEVHELKKSPIILEVQMKFKLEIKNRERIVIKTRCFDYSGKIGKIEQIAANEKGQEACTAVFTFGFFDLETRRLIPPTPEWLKAIGLD